MNRVGSGQSSFRLPDDLGRGCFSPFQWHLWSIVFSCIGFEELVAIPLVCRDFYLLRIDMLQHPTSQKAIDGEVQFAQRAQLFWQTETSVWDFTGVKVTDRVFRFCMRAWFSYVREVRFSSPYLTRISWPSVCDGLHTLSLSRCPNLDFSCLGDLPRTVKTLDLSHNPQLQTSHLAMANVSKLDLTGCGHLGRGGLEHVSSTVGHLVIACWPDLTDGDLSAVPLSVEHLDVSQCPGITVAGLSTQQLMGLNISECHQLGQGDFEQLPPGLYTLIAERLRAVSPGTIGSLRERVSRLNLSGCCGLGAAHLAVIRASHLELRDCSDLPPQALQRLSRKVRRIDLARTKTDLGDLPSTVKEVVLENDPSVTGNTLARPPKSVTSFGLSDNPHLTPDDLRQIPWHVVTVHLFNCSQVGRAHLEALHKGVISLGLSGCDLLTVDDVRTVLVGRPMRMLNVSGCPKIPPFEVKALFPRTCIVVT